MPIQSSQGTHSTQCDRSRTCLQTRALNRGVLSLNGRAQQSEQGLQKKSSSLLSAPDNEIIRILNDTDENFEGPEPAVVEFQKSEIIFSQGTAARNVLYIQSGDVKLSVVNEAGREAIMAILGPGDFLGEACLAGQPVRSETAIAIIPTAVRVIEKNKMLRLLRDEDTFSELFISNMIKRSTRVKAALVDQLLSYGEKRLARALIRLAHRDEQSLPQCVIPRLSQEMLAQIVGTTRSQINVFMNKFRKLGFIEYDGGIKLNRPLLGG